MSVWGSGDKSSIYLTLSNKEDSPCELFNMMSGAQQGLSNGNYFYYGNYYDVNSHEFMIDQKTSQLSFFFLNRFIELQFFLRTPVLFKIEGALSPASHEADGIIHFLPKPQSGPLNDIPDLPLGL